MGKFFLYVFGIFVTPKETLQKIADEPNKKLMTIFTVIWDNLLLVLIMAVVIVFRLNVWMPEYIDPMGVILFESFKLLLLCNFGIFVFAFIHYLYMKGEKKAEPSMFYTYYALSLFLLLMLILFLCRVIFYGVVSPFMVIIYFGLPFGLFIYFLNLLYHIEEARILALPVLCSFILIASAFFYYASWAM